MLLFSDSFGHALLAYVIKNGPKGRKFGRTHMQKIPYILKAIDVLVPFSYRLYFYGPYSQDITFAIDDLIADDVIKDTSPDRQKFSSFIAGENCDELIGRFKKEIGPHETLIKKVIDIFNISPEKLELITTLHYLCLELKTTAGASPAKKELISAFKGVKGNKFTDKEISQMIKVLSEIGFIKLK